jgi:hypothetical protein
LLIGIELHFTKIVDFPNNNTVVFPKSPKSDSALALAEPKSSTGTEAPRRDSKMAVHGGHGLIPI